ncbi:hypothetical protein RESH_03921 [Rhodopirellula europaea SH398]|jgi:hypothetical protein|uniref:Uncharacterized protein n=1 Tax=Rhodopirellula europaea SH398 TaxID=1263868 RepID=M5S1V5_9BACT|nr:hypothetical protein RESH_03921 [Rhodopirellula europaea SH398]
MFNTIVGSMPAIVRRSNGLYGSADRKWLTRQPFGGCLAVEKDDETPAGISVLVQFCCGSTGCGQARSRELA